MGDRNNKFFHQATFIRRPRNRIATLLDDNDNWIYGDNVIHLLVQQFYSSLYSSIGSLATRFQTQHNFPAILDGDLVMLNREVSLEETRRVLFSMQNLKATGPDGFHPLFFMSQWEVLGNSIWDFMKICFAI